MKKNSCKISFLTKWILSSTFLLIVSFGPEPAIADLVYVGELNPNSVTIIDTTTNAFVGPLIPVLPRPFGVAVTPNGDFVYVANDLSNQVTAIETVTNTVVAVIAVGNQPRDLAITPNGLEVWVPDTVSGSISIIDTATNTVTLPPIVLGAGPSVVRFDPKGLFAYVGCITAPTLFKFNAITKAPLGSVAVASTTSIAVTPDGATIYLADLAPVVHVIDAGSLTPITTIPVGTGPKDIAITPDGTRAYVANQGSNNVSVLDILNNIPLATISGIPSAAGVTITANGAFAYVTSNTASGNIYVIKTSMNAVTDIILPFAPGMDPFRLAAGPGSPAVTNLTGSQQKEDSGLEYQLFNTLSWEADLNGLAGFFVYRDGIKIATLDTSTLQYTDNNRKKGVTTVYSVTSFTMNGTESAPTTIEIK